MVESHKITKLAECSKILAGVASYLSGDQVLELRCLWSGTREIHERVAELRAAQMSDLVSVEIKPNLAQYMLLRQLLLNQKLSKKVSPSNLIIVEVLGRARPLRTKALET